MRLSKASEVTVQGILGKKSNENTRVALPEWKVQCEKRKKMLENAAKASLLHMIKVAEDAGLHPKAMGNQRF